jgi:Zinc finger, ZZ type
MIQGRDNAYPNGFYCDVCMQNFDRFAPRVHCLECEDYDLCQTCFKKGLVSNSHEKSHEVDAVRMIPDIVKVDVKKDDDGDKLVQNTDDMAYCTCAVCATKIPGSTSHFRCLECSDFHICRSCYVGGQNEKHDNSHKFEEVEGKEVQGKAVELIVKDNEIEDHSSVVNNPDTNGEVLEDGEQEPREMVPPEVQERYMELMRRKAAARQEASGSGTEPHENPWNPVCVVGLRVYSRQENMKIMLVKPSNMAEASMLDAGGVVPAEHIARF